MNSDHPKAHRGFAAMSPDKQREIASKGGRAAHEKGVAHEWTVAEAKVAGYKGGCARRGIRHEVLVLTAPSGTSATE